LIGGVAFLLEFPYAPLTFMKKVVNFFNDFRFRAGFYGIIGIPAFVTMVTIFSGIVCWVTGGVYVFCWYRKEKGEDIKIEGSTNKVELDASTNNSKSKGLAAQADSKV